MTSRPRPDAGRVPGLAARLAAAAAVRAVLAREATLDDALAARRGDDDPLVRAIAVATFRRFGLIRSVLTSRLAQGLPDDPAVLALLATGAAQVLVLDVPDHAAVDLTVEAAAASPRTRHLAGLANAVLRRITRERDDILARASPLLDLPPWLASRWPALYGPEATAAMAAAHAAGGAIDLTCRSDAPGWAARLGGRLLPTGSVRLGADDRRPVSELPGYSEGAWWVQDAAAALPARMVSARAGERVLDMCAAPGGKTAQLAAGGARVTALDRSGSRLKRLQANMDRLGLEAEVVCADALSYEAEPFDAVLLDAPCTATGTLRRHPDVGWTRGEPELARLVAQQASLLDAAAGLVRPGGRLVFCTCSLEPEEGEGQIEAFLTRWPDFARLSVAEPDADLGFPTAAGAIRTRPDCWPPGLYDERGGLDGFFAARLVKAGP